MQGDFPKASRYSVQSACVCSLVLIDISCQLIFSQQMMLLPGLFCSKISLLLLLLQIFDIKGTTTKRAIWLGMFASFALYFPGFPIEIVFQSPSSGQGWDGLMLSGKPNRAIYWGLVQSCVGILLDLYIFVLPLPTILRLNMSLGKRIQVSLVFSTAFL